MKEKKIRWPLSAGDRLFFNGYQTWTTSKELGPDDIMKDADFMPRPIVNHWGIDRYGDYHFIEYSNRPGDFHGFSYCYKRNGENYHLIASTDETDGYTVFRYDAKTQMLRISKDVPRGNNAELHLFEAKGSESEVFNAWFGAMGINARPASPLTGYSSWYNRYENISDETISADLEGCSRVMQKGDLFQIDDGWESCVGDWFEDSSKFPRGMKASADDIHDRGFLAGLWLAPFVTGKKSQLFRDHPDWLLQHNGEPWYCGCNWGGFYSLDIDNPGVQDYLKFTFDKVFNDWGFDLVKLDFLYGAAPWHTDNPVGSSLKYESRGARMCRAMRMLREWCGDKLILGCGVPLWPAFGLVDYCRISCDVGLDWRNNWVMRHSNNECVSTVNAIANTYYRRQLNGRAFLNDPDVFFLRKDNIRLSEDEKTELARTNAKYGGLFLTSDNMGEYDSDQLASYRYYLDLWKDSNNGQF